MVDVVLGGLKDQCCVAYSDDILIYSHTPEEHVKHLQAVLQLFKEHRLFVKLQKHEFFKKK